MVLEENPDWRAKFKLTFFDEIDGSYSREVNFSIIHHLLGAISQSAWGIEVKDYPQEQEEVFFQGEQSGGVNFEFIRQMEGKPRLSEMTDAIIYTSPDIRQAKDMRIYENRLPLN